MVGGLVTSFFLELTIYPAVFAVWKRVEMEGWSALIRRPDRAPSVRPRLSPVWRGAGFASFMVLALTLGLVWAQGGGAGDLSSAPVVFDQAGNGLEVTLRHPDGAFQSGTNRFGIRVVDAATGEPLAATAAGVQLFMPAMGAMQAMTATAEMTPAGSGEWPGQVSVPMTGEWRVTVKVEGPDGPREVTVPTVAR
jgi:hypothetical protein